MDIFHGAKWKFAGLVARHLFPHILSVFLHSCLSITLLKVLSWNPHHILCGPGRNVPLCPTSHTWALGMGQDYVPYETLHHLLRIFILNRVIHEKRWLEQDTSGSSICRRLSVCHLPRFLSAALGPVFLGADSSVSAQVHLHGSFLMINQPIHSN